MKLKDCETRELVVRGMAADVIFGRERVTAAEGRALLAEYRQRRPGAPVAYLSRDGWQLLDAPVTAADKPAPAPAPAAEEEMDDLEVTAVGDAERKTIKVPKSPRGLQPKPEAKS